MNRYVINKYPPRLYKKGRFLREDWISCSDIDRVANYATPSRDDYLRVEGLYVATVESLAALFKPAILRAHDVEFWEVESRRLSELELDDVFDDSPSPQEGEALSGSRLVNVTRRCLREVAWLELVIEFKLLIHFGYDFQIVIATDLPWDTMLEVTRSHGLFLYESNASLPTLGGWQT